MDTISKKTKQELLDEAADEDKLNLIEGGIEQNIIDGDADEAAVVDGSIEVTAQDKTLSKKLVQRIQQAIDSSFHEGELVELCQKAFQVVIHMANTSTSAVIQKQLAQVARSIKIKVKELGQGEGQAQKIFDSIITKLVESLAIVQFGSDEGSIKLSYNGALTVYSLLYPLLKKDKLSYKLTYDSNLVRGLVALTHSLVSNIKTFKHKNSELYQLISKNFENFSAETFKADIQSLLVSPIKYTYLALSALETQDSKLLADIGSKFSSLVMNDKEKSCFLNFPYFLAFLSGINESTFRTSVYPEIEFMMKRGLSLISLIAQTVQALTFRANVDVVKILTSELFSEEYLVKEDYVSDVKKFFEALASQVDSKEAANALIIDYLFKEYQKAKSSSGINVAQRLAYIRYFSATAKILMTKKLIVEEQIQPISVAIIEHIFQFKDEAALKDILEDIVELLNLHDSKAFLVEPLKKQIVKPSSLNHIHIFTQLLDKQSKDMNDILMVASSQFKPMLVGENFKNTISYSSILALIGFFCSAYLYTKDSSHIQWMVQNENIISYIGSSKGYVNTLGYFQKNPSYLEVSQHLKAISQFAQIHYGEQPLSVGDVQLRDTICEYVFNDQYRLREHLLLDTIEQISAKGRDQFIGNFVKTLFNKLKQVSQRPINYNREEAPHKGSQTISNRVRLALKLSLKHKQQELTKEEFVALVKLISHPLVSPTNRDLLFQLSQLEEILPQGKLQTYFFQTQQELINFSIRSRTGILSHDKTLRTMSINIGVCLAQQNLLVALLPDLIKILNYKPLEMTQKLEKLFKEEFEKISFYDLMMYSEVSKDLLHVFDEKDSETVKRELGVQIEVSNGGGAQGVEEESKEEDIPEAAKNIDPTKLAAMMLKQQAAAKKNAAAAKKPATAAKAAPAKQAAAPAKKVAKEEAPAHQPVDKEKRRQADRDQILGYIQDIQRIKGEQVSAALEIVKRANQNNLFLDLTLNHLLLPMIKLLNYSATRFATTHCFTSLFEYHKREPLFQVKNEIVSCLQAISAQRIYIKHMREFQAIFQHIEGNTQVGLFDKGYIQMIMMMANFVLKDLSVHLSVKEQALAVVQSILEDSSLVENIDLVIVTINMMKSSYNNENLAQYLNILLRRLNLEQLALILQRIFEYEPVPRIILMKELLEYELPLCCPVWFSTQIWVLQYDEECGKLARKLWNKYGLVLRQGALDLAKEHESYNIFYYLRSKNTNIFDNSIRGLVGAMEIFHTRFDLIMDDMIEFYDKEMQIIQQESLKVEDGQASQGTVIADERLNRIAVAEVVRRTAHMQTINSFKKVFDFFITQGCLDQNEQVAKACMDAALQVIHQKGPDYAEDILKILEKYINEQKKYSELSKNQAIIMIGALANFLDNASQKKLINTFEKMLELLNSPSELIRQSICRVIPQLARFFEDKSRKFLEDHMKILKESQDDKVIRGSAYAVSGIIKGLGMSNMKDMDLLNTTHNHCFTKHADPMRKISGLYLYETLTISLGKVFEMNVEKILPDVILCISDPKEHVRRAATQANRTIMSRLSNHAIKQVLPIFLKGLYNDNWRSKLASVEALGNMAFCAPRQISGFLPHIVKGIREVLSDTHEKVHEAALQAIQNIGSVIKCPEIADILQTLVKALSNPNQHLKDAMKVLLETSFVHAIDAPSLSLLIPILDSGLMMHDNESKHLASKLMGNICNLTQDPADLLPYIKILMPAIKNSLFDSIPEIRASASKALGSLSKGLGLDNSQDMLLWLHEVLHQKQLVSSERTGAAQGFAEIVSVHGVKFFEETIKIIVVKSQDQVSYIRESYRSVMVFLATCYDQFVKYLPKLLPIMIQGLSDDVEDVRKISMRNVKICIKLFGRIAPNQLVDPIMEMMFHKDFRVRQSSSVLMYQLVKELENDVIKLQPKYVSIETKNDILACMFILKYDIIERVATQAAQIWKNIIDNQLKVLKTIIDVLTAKIFGLIQNDNLELQEMGLNCMRGITEKFGEKFVGETLDILESYMERATSIDQNIAVTKAIFNMVSAAPIKLITDLRLRFLTVVDGNITSENEEIRSFTAKIICITLQKTFEPIFMTQTIEKHFLKKLHHLIIDDIQSKEADLLVLTLKETLKEQPPELKLEDKIIRLCNTQTENQKFTIAQARVIAAVAVKISANMFKKKNCTMIQSKLMNELTQDEIDDERRIKEVLLTFSEILSQAPENDIVSVNDQIISEFHNQCLKRGRLGFYVDFITYYCTNAKVNYEKFARMYLDNVLTLMNDQDEKLVEKVIKSFTAVINGLQKEYQFTLIPLIKGIIEQIAVHPVGFSTADEENPQVPPFYKKKVATIKMLEKAEGVKSLSAVIQNSITHGSVEVRIDSAICFQYLIDFSKPEAIKLEVIKICGALIRVVNDKFAPALKLQIFHALKLILLRASMNAKAMAPQLQTTFLKAFNDSLATSLVRKVVVDCLIHFLKIAPKVDPILKELSIMIEGDKLENEAKIEVAEILAIIIRSNGKTVQQAMSQQIQTTLLNILQNPGSYNDKTIVNCSVALAFLSAYASEAGQMLQMFEAYDNKLNLNISFGIKFGVLLNGASSAHASALIPKLESYSMDMVKDLTGLQEVDGSRTDDGDEESGLAKGRLHGSFEILGHIGDVFVRRFASSDDELYKLQYRVINQSGIFAKLNEHSDVSEQTHDEVLFYLSSIPVKTGADGTLNKDLLRLIKDGLDFINKFYLEFDSKRDATPACLNLLMLNYDHFLDINDDARIQVLTPQLAKSVANKEPYLSLLEENIRMLAVELSFI